MMRIIRNGNSYESVEINQNCVRNASCFICFLYNVVSENYRVRNPPGGRGGSMASSIFVSIKTLTKNLMQALKLKKQNIYTQFFC